MSVSLDNEAFALRDGESFQLFETQPTEGRWIAIMARSVEMPAGERNPTRTCDGAPVEQAAILACEWSRTRQNWHWQQISPPTKERIGDLMFDNGAEKDRWYYLVIWN